MMLKITTFLKNFKVLTYRLLKDTGRQSKLNDIVEYVISAAICLNVILIIFESMGLNGRFGAFLSFLRVFFFVFFLTEYILRVWIADFAMKDVKHPVKARIKYMLSFSAVINLLALMPVMLGSTVIDFRVFRILRLLRLTQLKGLKQYTDIFSKVLKLKGAQLLSSLFIVFIFMLVSAVIIYDLERRAQPETFNNILSCLWWSMSAVTTVGYGDMYPITPPGKIYGSLMSVFGVFLMAVPIGILTSGFFEVSKKVDSGKNNDPQ